MISIARYFAQPSGILPRTDGTACASSVTLTIVWFRRCAGGDRSSLGVSKVAFIFATPDSERRWFRRGRERSCFHWTSYWRMATMTASALLRSRRAPLPGRALPPQRAGRSRRGRLPRRRPAAAPSAARACAPFRDARSKSSRGGSAAGVSCMALFCLRCPAFLYLTSCARSFRRRSQDDPRTVQHRGMHECSQARRNLPQA